MSEEDDEIAEAVEAATAPAKEEDPTTTGGKRLAPAVWNEIAAHWEYGTMTGAEISRKYDVSTTSLRKYFIRHGIFRNSKKHILTKKAEEKIVGAAAAAEDPVAIAFEAKRKGRIASTRENLYQLSATNHVRAVMIMKDIHDGTRTPNACANDIKALRQMEAFIERNLANRFKILNAETDIEDGDMPSLLFRDLSEEEILQLQKEDGEDGFDIEAPEAPATLSEDPEADEIIEVGGK